MAVALKDLTVWLPSDLKRKLQVAALENNTAEVDVAMKALAIYLAQATLPVQDRRRDLEARRRDNPERWHCQLPPPEHYRLKRLALDYDTDMTTLVQDALEDYLD